MARLHARVDDGDGHALTGVATQPRRRDVDILTRNAEHFLIVRVVHRLPGINQIPLKSELRISGNRQWRRPRRRAGTLADQSLPVLLPRERLEIALERV